MVTTESLVDSVMFRWLPLNFPIQARPSHGNHFEGLWRVRKMWTQPDSPHLEATTVQ